MNRGIQCGRKMTVFVEDIIARDVLVRTRIPEVQFAADAAVEHRLFTQRDRLLGFTNRLSGNLDTELSYADIHLLLARQQPQCHSYQEQLIL